MNASVSLHSAMAAIHLPLPESLIADGQFHRYGNEGKISDGPFWYCLVGDTEQICTFGDAQTCTQGLWHSHDIDALPEVIRHQLLAKINHSWNAAFEEFRSHISQERTYAEDLFKTAKPAEDHPYLTRHYVESFGLRVDGDFLLIPLRDATRRLCSVQRISPVGRKEILLTDFEPGCYFAIGKPIDVLVICIDYVTAASIHMATGWSTATAFSSDNIESVVKALRKKFPSQRFLIAADAKDSDPASIDLTDAFKTAKHLGIRCAIPRFDGNSPVHGRTFNDLHVLQGLDAVRIQLIQTMEDSNAE